MGLLERLEPGDLPPRHSGRLAPTPTPQHPVPCFLPPFRQHEGVNVQRVRHGLNFNSWFLTQPHRGEFELQTVPVDLS
jgi:hypothetical protein